jgi:glycosyltransferase involved in cell wall biosynthesis
LLVQLAPLVSVVMPNLNKGKYIEDAIESVLSQTLADFELLVVDNGSEDSSLVSIERFCRRDPRVRLLRESRRGVGYALNTGIKSADGEFVTLLASDDICHSGRLSQQVKLLEERGTAICYSEGWIIDDEGAPTGQLYNRDVAKLPQSGSEGSIFHEIIRENFIIGGSVMASRKCLEDEPFDTSLTVAEDWDLWVRLARRFPFYYISQPLYGYRVHSGNVRFQMNQRKIMLNHAAVFAKWLRIFDDLDDSDKNYLVKRLWNCYVELDDRYALIRLALAHRAARGLFLDKLKSFVNYRVRHLIP